MIWKPWKNSEKIIRKKPTFPCAPESGCLVVSNCSKLCDKIEMDEDKVMQFFMEYKCCPDCGSNKFMGDALSASTNVKCCGCGHWFSMGLPLFIWRIYKK